MGVTVLAGLFMLTTGTIISVLLVNWLSRDKRVKRLHTTYQLALTSGNKLRAAQAGLAYYYCLRDGYITPEDDQALVKAIAAMDQ